MLTRNRLSAVLLSFLAALVLSACAMGPVTVTDAKTAVGIDEKLMPVQAKDVFPEGTRQVSCWFQWRDAKVGTKVVARWHFVTDNIHILNYEFTITRKEGTGGISMSMPEGKILPKGKYRVDLTADGRTLKTLGFEVK